VPLSRRISLGGAVTHDALAAACRRLVDSLACELEEKWLVYREVALEAFTEGGRAREEMRLARPAPHASLALHAERLLSRLKPAAPVEALVLTVDGLAPAACEQTTIFQLDRRNKEARLEHALAALSGKYRVAPASALEPDRREKMLAFYDPFRWGRAGRGLEAGT